MGGLSVRYLSEIIGDEVSRESLAHGWEQVDVTGITSDSRHVKPGYLFVAIPGVNQDGRAYIADAIAKGAGAVLTDRMPEGIPHPQTHILLSQNPRHAVSVIAARFFALQPAHIALVTGTDGKTSTAHFFQQLWRIMGEPAASIGTLGVIGPTGLPDYPAINTTPDPVLLHDILKDLARHGVQHVAVEASSHGLDQRRLDGVKCRVAGFTNITRDHLDYHHTEEA
ncbi:MAG: UDP-N-acetylmuramoyl-L-alanyl-D-glutamate--2,6-diaminopimelate ligase, partial [Alphaproteobacteria bacterium]|nr:UDP-N-acetylmuramoyl-L-alanyl-D-glutamate--2,6-diaminopimelate ligase [Alphaproteobacteria bacterium]